MFSFLFSVFSTLLLGLSPLINAVPVTPVEFIAVAPSITNPTAGAVWPAGSHQTVTWKTDDSDVPPEARGYNVTIFLGSSYGDSGSENLDTKHPLGKAPIMAGTCSITVPSDATCGNNCIVVLIGDSGNASPRFTITS